MNNATWRPKPPVTKVTGFLSQAGSPSRRRQRKPATRHKRGGCLGTSIGGLFFQFVVSLGTRRATSITTLWTECPHRRSERANALPSQTPTSLLRQRQTNRRASPPSRAAGVFPQTRAGAPSPLASPCKSDAPRRRNASFRSSASRANRLLFLPGAASSGTPIGTGYARPSDRPDGGPGCRLPALKVCRPTAGVARRRCSRSAPPSQTPTSLLRQPQTNRRASPP